MTNKKKQRNEKTPDTWKAREQTKAISVTQTIATSAQCTKTTTHNHAWIQEDVQVFFFLF